MGKQKLYFVSGVCGVGKSAIMPHLKSLLQKDNFVVRDFDERGVPDGADRNWRREEVKKWIAEGEEFAQSGLELIVCGFVKPKDFDNESTLEIVIIMLDADPEIIRKRLIGRYSKDGVFDETQKVIGKPVQEFIESNVYYSKIMKEECSKAGCPIIDTTNRNPEEVSVEVSRVIKDQL